MRMRVIWESFLYNMKIQIIRELLSGLHGNTNDMGSFVAITWIYDNREILVMSFALHHTFQTLTPDNVNGILLISRVQPTYRKPQWAYLDISHTIWMRCGTNLKQNVAWAVRSATGLLPDTLNRWLRMHREYRELFPRPRLQSKPLVSDPGMHHDTCVTHVPWCMSGSLTRYGGVPRHSPGVPGIPGACATHNFTYLARGPWICNFTSDSKLDHFINWLLPYALYLRPFH